MVRALGSWATRRNAKEKDEQEKEKLEKPRVDPGGLRLGAATGSLQDGALLGTTPTPTPTPTPTTTVAAVVDSTEYSRTAPVACRQMEPRKASTGRCRCGCLKETTVSSFVGF